MKSGLQGFQLRRAPHHLRLGAFHPTGAQPERARLPPARHIRLHCFVSPAHRQRRLRLQIEEPTHQVVRILRYQHPIHGRCILQTTREVDGIANRGKLPAARRRCDNLPQQRRSRIEAHPQMQRGQIPAHPRIEIAHGNLHLQRGAHRALRIILARLRHPPQRHHPIAHVLINKAPVRHNHRIEVRPEQIQHLRCRLGVQRLA
ncbi:MAG: hypothetical protein BWY25_03011 [Chloroflexi bacterium ADurb.Bin222]|nr:MAG: hypothetical protein BWY25_03011 [Chloroflexi bacterium ADurb.Bin222]